MTQSFRNTVYLCKKSYQYLFAHCSLLIFPLLEFSFYCLLEILALSILYWRYGIHVLNDETLELWSTISSWDFGVSSAIILGPLYFISSYANLFSKLVLTIMDNMLRTNQPNAFFASIKKSCSAAIELLNFALLSTYITIALDSGLKLFIRKQIKKLGAQHVMACGTLEDWYVEKFLVIPIVGFENKSLADAIARSRTLMHTKFGTVENNFSFNALMWLLIGCIGIIAERIITYNTNQLLGIAVFFAVLGGIMTIIRTAEGIFQAETYRTCVGQPTKIFQPNDFTMSFIQQITPSSK